MDSEEEILMEEAGGRRRPGSDLGRSKGRGEPHLWRCSAGGGGAGGRDESLRGEKREREGFEVWGEEKQFQIPQRLAGSPGFLLPIILFGELHVYVAAPLRPPHLSIPTPGAPPLLYPSGSKCLPASL